MCLKSKHTNFYESFMLNWIVWNRSIIMFEPDMQDTAGEAETNS